MKPWVWAVIGVGAAAVAVTGVGVAEHYAHAAPANGGGGGSPSLTTLQPNTTYSLKLSCPAPIIPVPLPPIPTTWAQSTLLAGVPITVQSVTPSGVSTTAAGAMATSLEIIFVYNGAQPMTLPPINAGNGTACSTTLSLPVSGPGPVHTGGANPTNLHNVGPQSVAVQSGQQATAAAIANGQLQISAPGNISTVQTGGTGNTTGAAGSTATVTLNGTAGVITVMWSTSGPNGSQVQVATIRVS